MQLTVSDLTFSYGGPDVLRDVSFTVDAGERVAVLGQIGRAHV